MDHSATPPPHDLAAEQAILGAVLRAGESNRDAAAKLIEAMPDPADFYRPNHQTLATHLRDAAADDRHPIEPAAILTRLIDSRDVRHGLDGPYLADLVNRAAVDGQIDFYAERVRRFARGRRALASVKRAEQRLVSVDDADAIDAAIYEAMDDLEGGLAGPSARPADPGSLNFMTVADLRAKVAAAGPRRWLLRGVWPAGDYGVHSIEQKGQKTWNTVDLAVSVASGTPWLGAVPVDLAGPVVMFAGEGSEGNLARRIDAVCAARGLDPDALPIVVCMRSPHLSDRAHRDLMQRKITEARPVLVTLDPFYLAVPSARGGSLYEMGELLEHAQHICQDAGAALFVVTHNNRNRGAVGAGRITGAGPAEWGRVLITGEVRRRYVDADTGETTVTTELEVIGGEVPGGTIWITRKIRADDPDDLNSPLRYEVSVRPPDDADDDILPGASPAQRKVYRALLAASDPITPNEVGDWIASKYGTGLKRNTISGALNDLHGDGLADAIDDGRGRAKRWFATDREEVS